MNDYPTEQELEQIKTWSDIPSLPEFIETVWNTGYGTFARNGGTLKLVTGGWSGNEDIIEAMGNNVALFWTLYWQRSERGGAFYFNDDMVATDLKWK
mgnify:CR=1 FL=1